MLTNFNPYQLTLVFDTAIHFFCQNLFVTDILNALTDTCGTFPF